MTNRQPALRLNGPKSAALTLVTISVLAASCATVPAGENQGKPIFASFNQCMVANGAGAVLVGVLAKNITGSKVVGVAAAAATLFAAWQACGRAHQRVTVSDERPREALAGDPRFRGSAGPVLTLDSLEVVAPKAGEDITTRYRFAYTSPDPNKKDIPAKERFIYLAGFTNDSGAQDFKEIEFDRDFVIQQGQRRHEHAVPSDASFNQFKPWKLRYQLEVDGRCVETEAAFVIDSPTPARAGASRPCSPRPQAASAPARTDAPANATAYAPSVPAAPAPLYEARLNRALRLSPQPGGAAAGKVLPSGTKLRALESRQITAGGRSATWVRVQTDSGESGWTTEASLKR